MRKYVKPMMESEAFVANEYIGACFVMDCSCSNNEGKLYLQGISPADAVVGYFGDGSGLKFVGEIVEGSGEFVMTGTLPGCGSGEKKDGHTDLPQVNVGGIDCTRYRDWPLVEIGCRIWTFFLGDGSVKENVAHHHVTFTDMSTIAGERHPNHS